MGWIIEALSKLFLSILDYMMVWSSSLIDKLTFDIGMDGTEGAFAFCDPATAGKSGLLGDTFPGAETYGYLFALTAMLLVFIIMIFKLYQGLLAPFTEAEPPLGIVLRAIIASMGVMCSFTIFVTFEKLFNEIFKKFKEQFDKSIKDADFSQFDDPKEKTKSDLNNNYQGDGGTPSNTEEDSSWDHVNEFWGSEKLINPDGENVSGGALKGNGLGFMVIEMMLAFAILFAFIKLVVEIFQRYITLGLLFYTCPLAFAMLASKSTKNVFSNWIQMLLSQFILMCMNLFFVGVYISAFMKILNRGEKADYMFSSDVEFVTTMLLLLGWLIVGQRVDEYMRSLGFSIANTGAGIGAALMAAGALTYKTIKGAGRLGERAAGMGVRGVAERLSGRSIGDSIESAKGSAADTAKDAVSNAKFGGMNSDEYRNAVGAMGGLDAMTDASKVNWEESARLSGQGARVIADSEGNILEQSAVQGSYAAQSLEAGGGVMRIMRDDGMVMPLKQEEYKAAINEFQADARMGRLPSVSGKGYDNNHYDTFNAIADRPGWYSLGNSKDPSIHREFNAYGYKNIAAGYKKVNGENQVMNFATPDVLSKGAIAQRMSEKKK